MIPQFVTGSLPTEQDPAWASTGACCPVNYAFWAPRACGVASLQSLVAHFRGERVNLIPTAEELLDAGAYAISGDGIKGLIYAPFVEYLNRRWGLRASVEADLPTHDLARQVASGKLAIGSVHPSIRSAPFLPPSRGGHLVTIWSTQGREVRLVNPSGIPGVSQHAQMPIALFDQYYARRAIVVEPRG